jgi:hypothetical protein
MASVTPGSLRAANVVEIRFPLKRLHTSLGDILGLDVQSPGVPGGNSPDLSDGLTTAGSTYLLGEILSKFDDGKVSAAKVSLTWERFHEAERLCYETNQRLAVWGLSGPYESELLLARKVAAKILGRFDWDAAAKDMGWGPGASTRLPRRMSDAAFKYSGNPETTIGCATLANVAICYNPHWEQCLTDLGEEGVGYCKIVPGNRIVTVPKNYKTDRTIAIEPCMNMYVQKGIGGLMRRRLRRAGCNLDDQSRNQRLAQVGSLTGTLATIDLSMASDTVSREIVSKLIRQDWLFALEQSRCPFGVLPSGEKIFYQKFSSMGNGFTFELETTIFLSLALACCHLMGEETSRVSVYGDDIILPSAVAERFLGLLQFCGFKANEKKSFSTGPFRESCGKHFFRGHEVTPFYVKKEVTTLPDLFLIHNKLKRFVDRSVWLSDLQRKQMLDLCKWVRSYAPAKWRKPRLPDGYGDGAFIGVFDEITPKLHPGGWECWVVNVIVEKTKVIYVDIPGLLPKALRSIYARPRDHLSGWLPLDESPIEVHPSQGGGYREVKILIPQYALGG